MKEPSRSWPFLPDFSSFSRFFPDFSSLFPLFFPIFDKFIAVKGGSTSVGASPDRRTRTQWVNSSPSPDTRTLPLWTRTLV